MLRKKINRLILYVLSSAGYRNALRRFRTRIIEKGRNHVDRLNLKKALVPDKN